MHTMTSTDLWADLRRRATISVEEAAKVLGIGRSAAYEAARQGQLPTLRLGRRLLVPVPQLLSLLHGEAGQQALEEQR